ncbi:MAG: hypothetical protein Q7T70_01805 [Polaromonas sp.]|nr:hypothetical protein [Polaromonas sp.]
MHAQPKPNHVPAEEDTVPPGDDSNTDPTPPLPADSGGNTRERGSSASHLRLVPRAAAAPPPPDPETKQEPDIDNERSIPSDGRDPEGEKMIEELDKPTEQNPDNPKAEAHGH